MSPDFLDLLREFIAAEVRFLVVGAYAVAAHAIPRATGDLDVWIEASEINADRAMRALSRFGAPLHDLTRDDLARPGVVFQIGIPPSRIDVITRISGVSFEEAWPRRKPGKLGPVEVGFIGRDDLITNKRAAGRPRDLEDVAALERSKTKM